MTHRQFAIWQLWLNEQWNRPDLTDMYLMQVACEVRRVLSQKPNDIKLEHFRLKFETGKPKASNGQAVTGGLTKEQKENLVKQMWMARLGGPGKIRGLPANPADA